MGVRALVCLMHVVMHVRSLESKVRAVVRVRAIIPSRMGMLHRRGH